MVTFFEAPPPPLHLIIALHPYFTHLRQTDLANTNKYKRVNKTVGNSFFKFYLLRGRGRAITAPPSPNNSEITNKIYGFLYHTVFTGYLTKV